MDIGALFNEIFLKPIINLLVLIIQLLNSLNLPGTLGLSIIVLTAVIRLLVWPFMNAQIKSAKKMAELKPHLDVLKEKHKGDKQALAQAQMALYKSHGVNPAGGCLPALIQIPIFLALYQAIGHILPPTNTATASIEQINKMLYSPSLYLSSTPDPFFLGLNIAVKPSNFTEFGFILLAVPVVTAALTLIQSLMTLPAKHLKEYPADTTKEKKEKEGVEESLAQVQTQMVYFMPIMIGYFAFTFPIGLAIYWNTYTILGIIQQYRVSGWGGLIDLINKINKYAGKIK